MRLLRKLAGLVLSAIVFSAVFTACEGNVGDNVRDAGETAESYAESLESGARKEMTDLETNMMDAANGISESLKTAKTKVADAIGTYGGAALEKVKQAAAYIGESFGG